MRSSHAAVAATALALAFAPNAVAADAEYVPGSVIVKYVGDASSAQKATARNAAGVVERLSVIRGVGGAHVVEVAGGVKNAVKRLEHSPGVRYAEPNYIYRALATPNDPRFGEMYGLDNTGQTGGTPDADIDAPEGWDLLGLGDFPLTGGAKVGIVDTGIQQAHPDLAGKTVDCGGVNSFGIDLILLFLLADAKIVDGKCNDNNGHGTHVAGTVGAVADNGVGVAGVAFNSPLAICKALNARGGGTLEMVANCIHWLNQRGAKVISMSLGSTHAQTLQAAVRNATEDGSLVVAAAGNSGNNSVSYPAGYAEAVSVAATDHNDQHASFSQVNSDVEIAAPGVNVLSTYFSSNYVAGTGTSMSTPHVSAVAALIAGTNPTGDPAEWRAALQVAVDDLGPVGRDSQFGFGRVSLSKLTP